MTDSEYEQRSVNPGEFFADLAVRLVERDMLAGNLWRPAATFGTVLDSLVDVTVNDDMPVIAQEWASNLLVEIVNNLLYLHVHILPGEQDINSQAAEFASMLDKAEELRKNRHEQKDEDQ